MKPRAIVFAPEARADLVALYEWISVKASPDVAMSYIERIETYCNGYDLASVRGHPRDGIRTGLRIVGFEGSITIAFMVSDLTVTILRLFYGGRNWEDDI